MYSLRRFVDHEGLDRSILPLSGKERSSLPWRVSRRPYMVLKPRCFDPHITQIKSYLQHVDTSIIEHLHTVVMIQTRVDTIHSDRIDTELLKVRQVSCAVLR